jgi:hypothetical protein
MLTKDQITWMNVTGNREVKRLPSHFIPVTYNTKEDAEAIWTRGITNNLSFHSDADINKKLSNAIKAHIEANYAGRYFIAINDNHFSLPIIGNCSILIAFEAPSEASFFMLQIKFLVDTFVQEIAAEKNI